MEHGTDLDAVRQRLLMDDDRRRGLPQLLTKREAAALLRVSMRTLERMLAAEELASAHVRGVVRIDVSDLRAYLARPRESAGRVRRRAG